MKSIPLLLFFLCSLSLSAQHLLDYNLKVNDTFRVNQQAKQHITQNLNGADQIIENNLQSTMHFKVLRVEHEITTLEMYFERMKMTMSSPDLGELLNIDTSNPDSEMNSKMFKGVLNIPITLVMERTGKIRSVSGGEKLIASMFKIAGITEKETIEANKAQFEKQFGSQALSNSFEQMTYFLPAQEVPINGTWNTIYNGDLEAKNEWSLKTYTEDSFIVSGKAITTMSSIDENVTMVLHGTQTTIINADSKTRLFANISVEGNYSGNTKVKASELIIPTEIKSTVTYKLLK